MPVPAVGTSGHVDHGKTALVRCLTGVNTDRAPQELERGLSIELGFAPLDLPDGRQLSLIDVPGHERFIRTMVAGAFGISHYLLAVAANDGVMPQTREHLAVLRALGITRGIIAITKSDLADPTPAADEIEQLVPEAVTIPCSARTGFGIEHVRAALGKLVGAVLTSDRDVGPAVLHIDRAFTVVGAGSIVTGTLWQGALAVGGIVQLHPSGASARIRGLQVHGTQVGSAIAGQRVAVNLAGFPRSRLEPGMVLATPDAALSPSWILNASLHLSRPPTRRVMVHHGTRHTRARVVQLDEDRWQIRCDGPLIARRGDPLVVRSIAPPDTLGGGRIVEPHARREGPNSRPLPVAPAATLSRSPRDDPQPGLPELSLGALALERRLRRAGREPPLDSDIGMATELEELRRAGRIERLGPRMHMHKEVLGELRARVRELIERDGSVTLSRLRDELGTSRKYAHEILDHCDRERLTVRLPDDRRVLRGKS